MQLSPLKYGIWSRKLGPHFSSLFIKNFSFKSISIFYKRLGESQETIIDSNCSLPLVLIVSTILYSLSVLSVAAVVVDSGSLMLMAFRLSHPVSAPEDWVFFSIPLVTPVVAPVAVFSGSLILMTSWLPHPLSAPEEVFLSCPLASSDAYNKWWKSRIIMNITCLIHTRNLNLNLILILQQD